MPSVMMMALILQEFLVTRPDAISEQGLGLGGGQALLSPKGAKEVKHRASLGRWGPRLSNPVWVKHERPVAHKELHKHMENCC